MSYNVKNLGDVEVYDLNNNGQLTGVNYQTNSAFLYSGGQPGPLPVHATTGWSASPHSHGALWVPELKQSQGNAVNESGDVAGTATIIDNIPANANLPGQTPSQIWGFTPKLRAFLIYQGKFVDLHTKLTEIGYFWSTAMDVTNRHLEGSLSVVGVGDQGPWLIQLTEYRATHLTPAGFSLQASSLCQAPYNLPTLNPSPDSSASFSNPNYYISIRINNFAQMAISSNIGWYLLDGKAQPPLFIPEFVAFTGLYAPVVESFNDSRDILLFSFSRESTLKLSLTDGGGIWTQSAIRSFGSQALNLEAPVSTNDYKRLMNNHGDVLLDNENAPNGDVSVFLNNGGSPVDLTQYLGSNNPNSGPVYGQGINDQGLICCSTGETSLLLTPQTGAGW
jgi:hypothetical protein